MIDIIDEYYSKIKPGELHQKVIATINSCKTLEQLEIAEKYARMARKQIVNMFNKYNQLEELIDVDIINRLVNQSFSDSIKRKNRMLKG